MKKFEFLPNGKTLASFKKEAKAIHKSGKAKSHSAALNALSKDLFNIAFNKLKPEINQSSPMIIKNTLYVPLQVDLSHFDEQGSFCYYVAISNDTLALARDMTLSLESLNVDIHSLTLENFCKTGKNECWWINFGETQLEIKLTDEGVVCDVLTDNGDEVIDSAYVFYTEILEMFIKIDADISDYKAAYLFGHDSRASKTVICTIGGISACLYGTFLIDTGGEILSPNEIVSMCKVDGLPEAKLFSWLQGKDYPEFAHYEVLTTPFLGLESENGEVIGNIFDFMPRCLSQSALMIAEHFI
jgi:hypothetical protein